MVINEKLLDPIFDGGETINLIARGATYAVAVVGVLGLGWLATRKQENPETETESV
jgi:hypothetical protein